MLCFLETDSGPLIHWGFQTPPGSDTDSNCTSRRAHHRCGQIDPRHSWLSSRKRSSTSVRVRAQDTHTQVARTKRILPSPIEGRLPFLRGGNLPFPRKLRETLASFLSLELDYH